MKILILGRGKTGSLVAQVTRERGHEVQVLGASENPSARSLTRESLAQVDTVIDFTTPNVVLDNIEACLQAKIPMVVGTTGWYGDLPRIRQLVEKSGSAFLYGANFSVGVNLFYEIARTAAAALQHEYAAHISERHHQHKKDAPSGTAIAIQQVIREVSGMAPEITSYREGELVGIHEVKFDSAYDSISIQHTGKSRIGFAEGAVRAAEWLVGKPGCYDFKDIWRTL